MRIRMKLVPEGEGGPAQVIDEGTTADPVAVHGTGPHSFVCGGCGAVLVEAVRLGQVESVVFRCAACQALNAIPRVMGGDSAGGG